VINLIAAAPASDNAERLYSLRANATSTPAKSNMMQLLPFTRI